MSITETVLIFGVVPLAAAGVLALLVFGAGARRTPRYRPGRPFEFSPVWFLAAPDGTLAARDGKVAGPDTKAGATALPAGTAATTKKGGARGTW